MQKLTIDDILIATDGSLVCGDKNTEITDMVNLVINNSNVTDYLKERNREVYILENGTIYLLDSLPRALENEKIGEGTRYKTYYDFVSDKKTFKEFNNVYNVTRVSDNVLKIELTEEKLSTIHNLLDIDNNFLLDDYRMMLLEPFVTYGTGMTFLTIPENEKVKGNK